MTSEVAHFLQLLASDLRRFGEIAAGGAIAGFVVIHCDSIRRVRHLHSHPHNAPAAATTVQPTVEPAITATRQAARAPAPQSSAAAAACSPVDAASCTVQAAPTAVPGDVRELAFELGVRDLVDRVGISRHRSLARERAAAQLRSLAARDCAVEFDFELAGVCLPAVLLTTSGVFAVLLSSTVNADELGTIVSVGHQVDVHRPALDELRVLTGVPATVVFYASLTIAEARCWFVAGERVFTAGGVSALRELMATERGPGLSEAALDVFSAAVRQTMTGERMRIPDAATGQG